LKAAKKRAEELAQANADPVKALFNKADTDEDKGELSFPEYSAFATAADSGLTDIQIKEQYGYADSDDSYTLTLEELRIYLANVAKAAQESNPLKKVFIMHDTTAPNDALSLQEWSILLRKTNPDLTDDTL